MSEHHPASFAAQILSRLSNMLRAVRRVRLVASLVAMIALPFLCNDIARSETYQPWIDLDLGGALETLGDIILVKQDNEDQLRSAARKKKVAGPSEIDQAIVQYFDLKGRAPNPSNFVSLQPPNLPTASGSGQNLSRDGNCAVGSQDSGFFTFSHAFRWTETTGPVDLGTLDPSNNASRSSVATDTNQDCSVVVGVSDVTANGATQHAFRWTSGGMADLGAPANGGPLSRAFGVSSNGMVIVGDADFPDPNNLISGKSRKAFRWTQAGGFQKLGDLQPGRDSIATAVSGDGIVVVGQAGIDSGINTVQRAFRWTTQTQTLQPIGPLPGHAHAVATGVSDNGKIVVGTSSSFPLTRNNLGFNNGNGAFRWTETTGIQDLRQLLVDNGVDMTGITLVSVTGMSPDGQWIQGQATTPQTGQNETVAFIAQVCDDDIGGPCSTTGAAPFTIGAAPNQLTVSAGQSGTSTITVTPDAGFTQPVTFSCSGLPVGAACSFAPSSVTPNGGPVTTALTISTNGGPVAQATASGSPTMFAYLLTPFVLVLTGVLLYRRPIDRQGLWTGLLLVLVVAMASCSSSDSSTPPVNSGGGVPATGTPAGISNVTVTASSGSGSTGVSITLTVTR